MKVIEVIFVLVVFSAIFIAKELRRKHNKHKRDQRTCSHCLKGEIVYRYVRVKLSPDRTGGMLRFLFSVTDYLCQTQGTCNNRGCPHKCLVHDLPYVKFGENMPIVIKENVNAWGFRSKFLRLRELMETFDPEMLIKTGFVSTVLRERGIGRNKPKKSLPFSKPELAPPATRV